MHVLLAALTRDTFAIEIMRFDYGFTVSMKGQEKFEGAPSLIFSDLQNSK